MGKWDYIVEEMLREDNDIPLNEAYHRTEEEQERADHGGRMDGFPFIGKKDEIDILNRLLAKKKIAIDTAIKGNEKAPIDIRLHKQLYGTNPPTFNVDMVKYALEHPEESEIFDDEDFKNHIFTPRQHQLAYGRNENEVYLDNACLEWMEKTGKQFGLDVKAEIGNRREELYSEPSDLDYASFVDLNTIIRLFKVVSQIFRAPPKHTITIPPKKESIFSNGEKYFTADKDFCLQYIRTELEKAFGRNGGKMKMPWTGGMVNGMEIDQKYNYTDLPSALDTAESILNDIHLTSEDGRHEMYGTILAGRTITQQQDADEEIQNAMKQDIDAFIENTKQDGYHTGVHWSTDGHGWIDPGESWEGMGVVEFQGQVPISSVDWAQTVATHMQFPNEKELWLYPGRPIFLPCCSYISDKIVIHMLPQDKSKCLIA